MFRRVKKVHFVGIGGIGMSGIAELLLNLGFDISGSDINKSSIIEKLIRLGADIHLGHSAINLTDADVLVYSSAVQKITLKFRQRINKIFLSYGERKCWAN